MYRFKSKADGDLIMMAPVGDQILRIIGREPAPQGIIEVAALPRRSPRSSRRSPPPTAIAATTMPPAATTTIAGRLGPRSAWTSAPGRCSR